MLAMSQALVELFIQSFKQVPSELILDFAATDDRVHGQREGRAFHIYDGEWCFLPLDVFCGEHPLVSSLRPTAPVATFRGPTSSACSFPARIPTGNSSPP
ncbi:MAG: transposase [Chthoniobacterales bacterium]